MPHERFWLEADDLLWEEDKEQQTFVLGRLPASEQKRAQIGDKSRLISAFQFHVRFLPMTTSKTGCGQLGLSGGVGAASGSWRGSQSYSVVSQRLAIRQATVKAGLKTLPTS